MKGLVVAKKKASAKKANVKKANVKKVAKKTVSSKSPKKVIKKSVPAKKKAVVKKTASKKVSSKKTVSKKAVVKKASSVKKPAVKKTPTPAPKKANQSKQTSKISSTEVHTKKINFEGLVTPLDDRLVVRVSGAERKTAGGLYIPDTVSDVSGNLEGQVVAVGRGSMNKKGHVRPMDVTVGDRVVFSQFAGTKIKIQNEDLLILRESEVLGVVSK